MKIHTLDLEFQGLDHAIAVFLLEHPAGLALVECGPASTLPHLDDAIRQKGFNPDDIRIVFLSHIHFDHAGAAWVWAERGADIWVHPKGLPHLAAPERLYNSARQIYGDAMDRLWGEMRPIPTDRLHAPEHGQSVDLFGLPMVAHYTPGHAIHHIAWQLGEGTGSVVFTGDVAGVRIGNGPVQPPCPPPDIDVEAWQQSIQLLRELPSETLYLTHYDAVYEKNRHLDVLETNLLSWANWMKPYAEMPEPPTDLVEQFKAFVAAQLKEAGADEYLIQRYEAANPAFMSVAGLMRYWKKKMTR
ncbi:MAG: MBL fold metallo-hydrolase [Saprospiraceae bacterium]|nr:MBL fold metallo-hydrolase [Saprospiraceae bacterium]